MTTAINEACIGNHNLVRGVFLVWEMSIFFCCWVGFSTPSTGLPQTIGFGEGVRQSTHGGSNKQDKRRENIFGEMRNTGGYNSDR